MATPTKIQRAKIVVDEVRDVLDKVSKRSALKTPPGNPRATLIAYSELTRLKQWLLDCSLLLTEPEEKTNKVGNVVRDTEDEDGWRVEWCDRLTSPRFNSKGAAEAYLRGLFLGRKPEYPNDDHDDYEGFLNSKPE